jgi:sec-independent protein translocase protein TatA
MTGLTQPWHIVLILMIALLLFGGRRLPEIGRSLGSGMREFKDSITGHHPREYVRAACSARDDGARFAADRAREPLKAP